MSLADRRRRQWVPLSAYFASSKTGIALQHRFGRDGLLVWVLYLAACKTNWIQGRLTYATEEEAWARLGLVDNRPDFDLDTFWSATGDLKQTSRRHDGHLTDVLCTHWEDWNKEIKRDRDAERMSRIRAEKTSDNPATTERLSSDEISTEVEVEYEYEVEGTRRPPDAEGGGRPRPDKPPRTQAALSFVRNGTTTELEPDQRDRYLTDEFNLSPLDLESVLEAAGRAHDAAERNAKLDDDEDLF